MQTKQGLRNQGKRENKLKNSKSVIAIFNSGMINLNTEKCWFEHFDNRSSHIIQSNLMQQESKSRFDVEELLGNKFIIHDLKIDDSTLLESWSST